MTIIYNSAHIRHETGNHVENPRRIEVIREFFASRGIWQSLRVIPGRVAERSEIEAIHSRDYLSGLAEFCRRGGGYLNLDTVVGPASLQVALEAVGSVLRAIDETVVTGGPVFALVRPPGHHAEHDQAMGFCLLNNIAIGARYAQKVHGIEKILIVDWDVHHGNGTQEAFYQDPSVLFFSIHQSPLYPGSGLIEEIGEKRGVGHTVNCPVPVGSGDETLRLLVEELLFPLADRFRPELILVSCGLDAHWADPIAGLAVTELGFGFIASAVKKLASDYCNGRLVGSLEGGYHLGCLPNTFLSVVREWWAELSGEEVELTIKKPLLDRGVSIVTERIGQTRKLLAPYWRL
ncbi:MAG: histone deacetylase [Armatimonadetes bacterium]|nr:histone deacetylase [Armatimonadota bacterium]